MLEAFIFVSGMGLLARLAGSGFGKAWHLSNLPEVLYCVPYAFAFYIFFYNTFSDVLPYLSLIAFFISYSGMQAATWMFLKWTKDENPNVNRTAKIKPACDWIAGLFGWKLGDEGYSWVAAGVKGFLIGLPVGGVLTAILWPLGYEIGSHFRGRVEKYGIDPHMFSEFFSGALGSLSILFILYFIY